MNIKKNLLKVPFIKLLLKYKIQIFTKKDYTRKVKLLSSKGPRYLIEYVWKQRKMPYELNLDNPKSYTEKLNWLKLNWYDEKAFKCGSKYFLREYIHSKGLDNLLVDLYGVYESPSEITLDNLPDKFVLKTSHDSGTIIFCTDKSKFDLDSAKKKLEKALKYDYEVFSGEWWYAYKKVIVSEKLLANDSNGDLVDYKFLCINGQVEYCLVCRNRFLGTGIIKDTYDRKGDNINIRKKHDNDIVNTSDFELPHNYSKMVEFAEILSSDFPTVRVDFYNIDGKIIIGEMTFADAGGFEHYSPLNIDYKLGSKLILPQKSKISPWQVLKSKQNII